MSSPKFFCAIGTVKELVALCTEASEGFTRASQEAHDYELKAVFREFAHLRSQMAATLQAELRLLESKLSVYQPPRPTWLGWRGLKALCFGKDDRWILRRCAHEEAATLDQYQTALKETIPPRIDPLVRRQLQIISLGLERLRSLRKAHQIRRRAISSEAFSAAAS